MGRIKRRLNKIKDLLSDPPTHEQQKNNIVNYIMEHGGYVGKDFDVYDSFIDMSQPYLISIGDNVTITHATLLTHDACMHKEIGFTKVGRISIGNNVFIGFGSIVLSNVTIGNNVIVGAGTVVAKDIPSNSVVVGNPCRVIGHYDDLVNRSKDLMSHSLIIDKLPSEIMEDNEIVSQIKDNGIAFIL